MFLDIFMNRNNTGSVIYGIQFDYKENNQKRNHCGN